MKKIILQLLASAYATKLRDDDIWSSEATKEVVAQIIDAKPDLAMSQDGLTLSDSQVDQIQSLIASQASETQKVVQSIAQTETESEGGGDKKASPAAQEAKPSNGIDRFTFANINEVATQHVHM